MACAALCLSMALPAGPALAGEPAKAGIPSKLATVRAFVSSYLRPSALIIKASDPNAKDGWTIEGTPPGYVVISSEYTCLSLAVTAAGDGRQLFRAGAGKDAKVTLDPRSCAPESDVYRQLGILTCTLKCQ